MSDDRESYFAAIKARRLLGLLRAEFWAQEEDCFDLVLACALARMDAANRYGKLTVLRTEVSPAPYFRRHAFCRCDCGREARVYFADLKRGRKKHCGCEGQTRGWALAEKVARYSASPNESGCILWTGMKFRTGYGLLRWRGRNQSAHRLAWTVANGDVPNGMHVLHRCDVRSCVNPAHLFLGTNTDNVADKTAKGRASKARWRGENSPLAKLTQAEADAIRAMPGRQRDIAAAFGVSQRLVGNIKRGECWLPQPTSVAALARLP